MVWVVNWLPTSKPVEQIHSLWLYRVLAELWEHTRSSQKMQQSIFTFIYLLGCLLNKYMLVTAKCNYQSQKVINKIEIDWVGDAFGFYNEETLKRVNYFLNLLPLIRVLLQLCKISFDNLVYFLVFLNENKQQVMRCFSHLGLHTTTATFSSERRATIYLKS